MKPKPVLLFATHNLGKVRELQGLLPEVQLQSLHDFPALSPVDEDQDTFAGNAEKKARAATDATGMPALADDSGLCVDALGGRPGIHSARYRSGTDADRYTALLEELESVPEGARGAEFVCALYLALPGGGGALETGTCRGEIAPAARGETGFGYDPIFLFPELGRTFAETGAEEKARYSHRARALARMRPHLQRLAGDRARNA